MKLIFLPCLLVASCLLSACQQSAAPTPQTLLNPSTPTSGLLPDIHTRTPVFADPTRTPTSSPTPVVHLTPSPMLIEPDATLENVVPDHNPALLLPDSAVVYSPSVVNFEPRGYLAGTSGFLREFREYLRSTGWTSSADIIQRVAMESSINPQLLLALVEFQSGSVLGQLDPDLQIDYLMGKHDYRRKGFYRQLSWVATQLSAGYYGWRDGSLEEFQLSDGIIVRPAPELNAGSVAILYYFAQSIDSKDWQQVVDPERGITALYYDMFGNPWESSQGEESLLPLELVQPEMILPFETDQVWSLTSGPHTVWDTEGAQAALDFAPSTEVSGCVDSKAWVVAVADGMVVRSEFGAVSQDLSGDGIEQTGWAILYLHIGSDGRVPPGTYLHAGDPIGHPSCEGGPANGTHVHIARKYNGEWIAAGGSTPFVMSNWIAQDGILPYEGSLVRGDQTVVASPYGVSVSHIFRTVEDD